jgi:MFS transporter, DHA2 family, multidrug resistance protein
MRQVGATIGVAVLGTVLSTVYQDRLHLPGLPAAAGHAARSGITGGLAVARAAGSAGLEHQVRVAYAGGLDVMLWVCAAIAAVAAVLGAVFLPRQAGNADPDHVAAPDQGMAQPVGAE